MRRLQFVYLLLAISLLAAVVSCGRDDFSLTTKEAPVCREGIIPDRPITPIEDTTFFAGPYLSDVGEDYAVLFWHTSQECDGKVLYGTKQDALNESATQEEDNLLVHEIKLTNLKVDTKYFYKVQSCNKESKVHSFHTAPRPGAAIRFVVTGDSRSDPDTYETVIESILPYNPYLFINTGDVVTDGKYEDQWYDEFLLPMRKLASEVPVYVSIGNHEGNAKYFYDFLSYPNPLKEEKKGWETFYSFTYGNVFFLFIDTNKMYFPILDVETEFSKWIEEQVASEEAQAATWRIAVGHEPGFSESWDEGGCNNYDGTTAIKEWFIPLLAENKFHVYFAGHTHAYERGMKDGVVQIIAGGGGSGLDTRCRDFPETQVVRLHHGFVNVEAECSTLTLTWYEIEDPTKPIDQIVLHKDEWGKYYSEHLYVQGYE